MVLTPKQERFCQAYVETGNASEAYRVAYDATRTKPAVVHVKACQLLASGKVAERVAALREATIERVHGVTVASLIAELEEARQVALKREQGAAMTAATLGKARLAGLYTGEGGDDEPDAKPAKVVVEVRDARKHADA